MNRFITLRSWLIILFLVTSFTTLFAAKKHFAARNIDIAGLVVNAQTLLPIESADIYDPDNNILGATDKNGYFKVTLNYTKTGAINFKLKVKKRGFQTFLQHENWADFHGNTQCVMYFGLQASGSAAKSFSKLDNIAGHGLEYSNVLANFSKVKEEKAFDDKLTNAKTGNENVFIQIDNKFYIVNNTGWIEVGSDKDLISVNNKQVLAAGKLNATIKRKNIKSMTPIAAKEEKFAIYTR